MSKKKGKNETLKPNKKPTYKTRNKSGKKIK